jgi:copper(I)-binding protein
MKRKKTTLVLVLVLVLVISVALVVFVYTRDRNPEIVVKDAIIVPSGMLEGVASSFMLIINDGRGGDKLIGCSIKEHPTVRGELHDVIDGKMIKIEEIIIPAKETIELKMGGLHLMFFDIPENLKDTVTLLLEFKESGTIEVKAHIRPQKNGHGVH